MSDTYGVIGYPVSHSLSPAMFGAAFWEYNMDSTYQHFEVKPEELSVFMEEVKKRPILGLSVTVPHKETVRAYLNEIDPVAKEIGAVNTVFNKKGRLKGYNTDHIGAVRAITDVSPLHGKRVVVVGAGGAAAALTYGCLKAGSSVTILNRTEEKAKELADRFGCAYGKLDEILQYPAEVLVHTTSVGMIPHTDASLVPVEYFRRGMIVMDIVYNPLETKLIKQARRYDCRIIPGYKMLLYQAEKQFEIWFNKKPNTPKMEKALLDELMKR